MRATILRQLELPNLPSASGVEVVGDRAYIIGDDSPFLYCLDVHSFAAGAPVTLFETAHFSTGRIPKDLKLDLESMTVVPGSNGETNLLLFGSGATSARENGFWVELTADGRAAATVYPVSLAGLYAALRAALPAGITLNLEAAAATQTELLLFQRTVGSTAGNLVFHLPLLPTLEYLRHRQTQVPPVQTQFYLLPAIEGKPAGFSGATVFQDTLFITASVEDTGDAVADGTVLGSFIGILPSTESASRTAPINLPLTQLVLPNGNPYRGKVESVAVRHVMRPGQYELLLVTDDDAGGSTAVVVEVTI
ncbi:DUF6929 family protein [Hymenobacter crusticola]|uniref:Uncharacterized protein n=1 Tax=Hymenobacter crusticola TaxID=1770526 RepID=A0A243WA93_9BACT|nr:hypothetical protein [Hymenobacter crusticola]OUJ72456.1 hypothetical protein BXP70_18005 [Hymenobacter crusticola]